MGRSYRSSASFGKRMEYKIIGDMLMEGVDVYTPLVDDHGVDAVIKKSDGTFVEIQIKARLVDGRDAAFYPGIVHVGEQNFYFIFYSDKCVNPITKEPGTTWIMTGKEFMENAVQLKNGTNKGKWNLKLNGTKNKVPYCLSQYEKYVRMGYTDFL